jgi:hypothetical protein
MNERTETPDHQLRMSMLTVIQEVGAAKEILSTRTMAKDRAPMEQELDRLQSGAHRVLELLDLREQRLSAH